MLQASASSGSLSSAGGQSASGGTDYLKSALEASAAQKDTFFQRKMEVGHHVHTLHSTRALRPTVSVLQGCKQDPKHNAVHHHQLQASTTIFINYTSIRLGNIKYCSICTLYVTSQTGICQRRAAGACGRHQYSVIPCRKMPADQRG